MKGTIGKYPITMHLHKSGVDYKGYYCYDRAQNPSISQEMIRQDQN
jgi:hypothetical protein